MNRFKRISAICLTALFAFFLLVAILLTYRSRNKTYSYFENRNLAQRPSYTAEDVLDGSFFTALEDYLIDRAAGHNTLSRLNTQLDLALQRPTVNDVVVQEDILLPWLRFESVDPAAVDAAAARMADQLRSVSRLVESYGGRYCYVAVPCQYAYHADRYPHYLNNRSVYTALSLAALRPALEQAGVPFLDMGEVFDAAGHPDEFSSAVDNHYSIYGAYATCRELLSFLNRCGGTIRIPDETAFSVSQLPTPYLGSRMRKLLGAWPSNERLSYFLPTSPVPFTRTDNGIEVTPSVYAYPADTDEWVTYSFYMGGDIGNTVIDTHRPELPSILVYGDSFTNAVECLIYLSFDQMHSLDFRYYRGGMSLGEYIETCRPDYVVCIRDYEALLSPDFNGTGVN